MKKKPHTKENSIQKKNTHLLHVFRPPNAGRPGNWCRNVQGSGVETSDASVTRPPRRSGSLIAARRRRRSVRVVTTRSPLTWTENGTVWPGEQALGRSGRPARTTIDDFDAAVVRRRRLRPPRRPRRRPTPPADVTFGRDVAVFTRGAGCGSVRPSAVA